MVAFAANIFYNDRWDRPVLLSLAYFNERYHPSRWVHPSFRVRGWGRNPYECEGDAGRHILRLEPVKESNPGLAEA